MRRITSPWVAFVALLAASSPAMAAEARFDILEIRVLGNTALGSRAIESVIYPFLGPGRTIADVNGARSALETAYHDAGYATVFVDIPEQQVEDGLVRLQVTEGKVDRVKVQGTRYFSNRWIRQTLPELQPGNVPRLPALQGELAALNAATPDLSVTPVLKAGRSPGTVDVNLKVADTLPVHGSLEVNDRYTANTSRLRVGASLSYTNLFQRQHALALQYQISIEKPAEVRALVASYSLPVRQAPGLSLAFYGVDSRSDVAVAAAGALAVLGTGRIYGARAVYAPRAAGATTMFSTTLGADYKSFLEDVHLTGGGTAKTPIHYLNWSASETVLFARASQQLQLDLGANFGVRGLVNDPAEFYGKRFAYAGFVYGYANYFDLRGGAQYTRQLGAHLQGYARLAGQYSANPLVSNEQLAIGGLDTVRGYSEAAALGDRGASATLELRGNWMAARLHVPGNLMHAFAFVDYGVVSTVQPLPGQASSASLAGYGLGLRLLPWHGFSSELEWATAGHDAGTTKKGSSRAHLQVKWTR